MGEPQRDTGAQPLTAGAAEPRARFGAQGAGGAGVDLPDGVVELADAGETGRENDVGHRQPGGLEEHPGGVGALGAGERDGPGAQLSVELALDLPGAVAQPPGESGDALAVHDAVADEPHRPADDVRADVPLGGAPERALSGRQRRQARKPPAWAAAAVR
ncbi:hypothetical protein SCALM49S_03143 [Streptomyces californicus]